MFIRKDRCTFVLAGKRNVFTPIVLENALERCLFTDCEVYFIAGFWCVVARVTWTKC